MADDERGRGIVACQHGRGPDCTMCRLLGTERSPRFNPFSPLVPRCDSCGLTKSHWPGCTRRKRSVRPDGSDAVSLAEWRQQRLGGRLE
jgi:hypothetical protein